jgi:hypothetical protein
MKHTLVFWKSLHEDARRMLRLARVRPIVAGCFCNAQKVVFNINLPGCRYAEGWSKASGSTIRRVEIYVRRGCWRKNQNRRPLIGRAWKSQMQEGVVDVE